MSENRPEWQQGDAPEAGKASEPGQYEQPEYPGAQDQQGGSPYGSYGQDPAAYGQQQSYGQQPYGQQEQPAYGQQQAGYPGYGQQPAGYPAYGQQAYPGYAQQPAVAPVNPGQTMGLAGLITAIFVPVVGLILSIIGLKQSKKVGMGNGMAVAGIVIGSLFTLLYIIYIIFIIVVVASAPDYGY